MIKEFDGLRPKISELAYVAENATLVGDVEMDDYSICWYGAVLRADSGKIRLGKRTCVQDNAIVHNGTVLGDGVVVGHGVILHGCTVEDDCLIGMGAIILDGAVIGKGSFIAAGSLVTMGTVIPPGSMVMGRPGSVKRAVTDDELRYTQNTASHYVEMAEKQLPRRSL